MQKYGRLLTELTDLKPEYVRRLNRLWLTTVEEVAGIIRLAELFKPNVSWDMIISLFANELEIPIELADKEVVQVVRNSIPDSNWYSMAALEEPLSFGLLLEEEDETPLLQAVESPALTSQELPSRINLLEQFPQRFSDIRDQWRRGTCVAFALTVLHEYIHSQIRNQPSPHLSEEFLYWAARNKQYQHAAGTLHGCGTHTRYALEALLEMGQCRAETRPYRRVLPCNLPFAEGDTEDKNFTCPHASINNGNASYLATGKLGPEIQTEAESFRLTGWKPVTLTRVPDIQFTLSKGYPVVISVNCYSTLYSPTIRHSGVITLPFQEEIYDVHYQRGAHALVAVGYEDDAAIPGGGYFVVRNSWGENWGDASPIGLRAGYGMIPYAYLQRQPIQILGYSLEPN